jgi:hypothetical protein
MRSVGAWRNHIWAVEWTGMLDLKISTCGSLLMFYRNLMAKDEFKNLGFGEDKAQVEPKKDLDEKGKKGELRW